VTGPYWRSRDDIAAVRPSARAVAQDNLFAVADDGSLVAWNGH
jgi:hypothetical protein